MASQPKSPAGPSRVVLEGVARVGYAHEIILRKKGRDNEV